MRQSSGAFSSGPRAQKRQRTAAVQDVSAPAAASSWFMVPMHAQERKEALHEPTHPRPLQEGNRHPSASCLLPSWEGLGVGSWFRCMRKNERRLSTNRTVEAPSPPRFAGALLRARVSPVQPTALQLLALKAARHSVKFQ